MKPISMTEPSRILPACGTALAVMLVLLSVSGWVWVRFLRFEADLNAYARAVRRATIPVYEKERLLDVIERLEDRSRNGERYNWLRWFRHDRIIREMLKRGIDGDEGRLIERELLRAEKELLEKSS